MQIIDLRRMRAGSAFFCDVCIIGSGPAGLSIARELAKTPLQVLVVESGGRSREDEFSAALNQIESVGAPRVMDQRLLRNRVLGGTSYTWSGRCIPLDAIDYEARPWVPGSGWPIQSSTVAPWLERAARSLGVEPVCDPVCDQGAAQQTSLQVEYDQIAQRFASCNPATNPDAADLRPVFWQFSRGSSLNSDYVRFGPRFLQLKASNIRVLTHATVTQLNPVANLSHIDSIEIASRPGSLHQVRSRCFILCAGGIENPRLLLASNRVNPRGVGNQCDQVGRYLMDHPRAVAGTFPARNTPAILAEFGLFHLRPGVRMQRGLSLSLETQRREQLLNCAAWMTQHVADDDVWRAMRALGRPHVHGKDRLERGKVVLAHLDQIALGAWNKFVRGNPLPRRMKHLDLEVMVEQVPDPSSRVMLSDRCDLFGTPIPRIDWKISEMERRTAVRLANAVNQALVRSGLPGAEPAEWVRSRDSGASPASNSPTHSQSHAAQALFTDPAHPMGATRMAESPQYGVVDTDCRVFGIDNLYIAGSSVFPTGGHANPTLMIVALALRLADTLRGKSPAVG